MDRISGTKKVVNLLSDDLLVVIAIDEEDCHHRITVELLCVAFLKDSSNDLHVIVHYFDLVEVNLLRIGVKVHCEENVIVNLLVVVNVIVVIH